METQNKLKSFPKDFISTWIAIIALTGGLAACGNKGGGSSGGTTTTTVVTTCTNCTATPGTLATMTSNYPLSASWVFTGDANMINSIKAYSPDAYAIYSGTLSVTGTINMTGGYIGNCSIPTGAAYTVSTTTAGSLYYATTGSYNANSPQMLATNGSTNFTFTFTNAVIYNYGQSLSGYLNITAVNGAACSGQVYLN